MEKKQTAVEWLEEQIKDIFYVAEASEMTKKFKSVYEQAKKMEREQIINAFSEATRMIDINDELSSRFNACLYYVQTYGGQDE